MSLEPTLSNYNLLEFTRSNWNFGEPTGTLGSWKLSWNKWHYTEKAVASGRQRETNFYANKVNLNCNKLILIDKI